MVKLEKNILVTGGTGFLGTQFIKDILEKTPHKIYSLTRSKNNIPYASRLKTKSPRIKLVEGDITDESVFKNLHDKKDLAEIIDEVWHIAASTEFRESRRASTFHINHKGTLNLLEQLKDFKRLRCLNFVSTSYVSGLLTHPSHFYETPANGNGAKNPYEESKQTTEKTVMDSGLPYAIYRPSIIVGSSDGSYIDTKTIYGLFNGIMIGKMDFLRGMGLSKEEIAKGMSESAFMPSKIVGVADAWKNIVPVDHVSELMLRIMESKSKEGGIYHLCCPDNYMVHVMTDSVKRILKIEGLDLQKKEKIDFSSLPPYGKKIVSNIEVFNDYMTLSDPVFVMQNTIRQAGEKQVSAIPSPTPQFFDHLYSSFFKQVHGERFNLQ